MRHVNWLASLSFLGFAVLLSAASIMSASEPPDEAARLRAEWERLSKECDWVNSEGRRLAKEQDDLSASQARFRDAADRHEDNRKNLMNRNPGFRARSEVLVAEEERLNAEVERINALIDRRVPGLQPAINEITSAQAEHRRKARLFFGDHKKFENEVKACEKEGQRLSAERADLRTLVQNHNERCGEWEKRRKNLARQDKAFTDALDRYLEKLRATARAGAGQPASGKSFIVFCDRPKHIWDNILKGEPVDLGHAFIASSPESVGEFWFGEGAEPVI